MENTSPLENISSWLRAQSEEIQVDIITMGAYFHPDENIRHSSGKDQVELFLDYLQNAEDDRDHVIRTFLAMKMIDHAFSGRDTEQGWTEVLDRHISLAGRMKGKGESTELVDQFIGSYDERKKLWIELSSNWYRFRDNELSDRQVADWHFYRMIDKN